MRIAGCFLEYNGKFVILLRHTHKPNGGTWGLPAGKIEPGETAEAAAIRELYEETGYQASSAELEHLDTIIFGSGENEYSFSAFRVRLASPHDMNVEGAAHAEFAWVTPAECDAKTNLIPDFHEALRLLGYVE